MYVIGCWIFIQFFSLNNSEESNIAYLAHIGGFIAGIVLIIIVTTYGDASTYVSFIEAKELYSKGNMSKIHVVGKLNRDAEDNIMGID